MRAGRRVGVRYRLVRPLRTGGRVWLAVEQNGREVALKTGLPDEIECEFDVLRRLEHPHIVRLLERVDTDDGPWLAFEYLAGGDLVSLAGFDSAHWLSPLVEVVQALSFLHRTGFVHRDVKARNVMLDAAGHARLIDFGSAAPIGAPWRTGGTTAAVVDPMRGARPVTTADDAFALARLLEELAQGGLPAVTAATARLGAALEAAIAQHGTDSSGDLEDQSAVIKSLLRVQLNLR
jgi:serine/threonine-protein kinase